MRRLNLETVSEHIEASHAARQMGGAIGWARRDFLRHWRETRKRYHWGWGRWVDGGKVARARKEWNEP